MTWQSRAWSLALVGGKSRADLKQNLSGLFGCGAIFQRPWLYVTLFSDVSFPDRAGCQSWDVQLSEGWFAKPALEVSLEVMAMERCELNTSFGDPAALLEAPALCEDSAVCGSIMSPLRVL